MPQKLSREQIAKVIALKQRYGLDNDTLGERFGVSGRTIREYLKTAAREAEHHGPTIEISDIPDK